MERRCRFVDGTVERLALSEGEWIEVKTELNAGEARRMFTDCVRDATAGEAWTLDPEKVGITQVLAYLTGWSLLDAQQRPAPISAMTLGLLDQDTLTEIMAAVKAHDEVVERRRSARKNGHDGETTSPATSPSLVGVAGASSGFAA